MGIGQHGLQQGETGIISEAHTVGNPRNVVSVLRVRVTMYRLRVCTVASSARLKIYNQSTTSCCTTPFPTYPAAATPKGQAVYRAPCHPSPLVPVHLPGGRLQQRGGILLLLTIVEIICRLLLEGRGLHFLCRSPAPH